MQTTPSCPPSAASCWPHSPGALHHLAAVGVAPKLGAAVKIARQLSVCLVVGRAGGQWWVQRSLGAESSCGRRAPCIDAPNDQHQRELEQRTRSTTSRPSPSSKGMGPTVHSSSAWAWPRNSLRPQCSSIAAGCEKAAIPLKRGQAGAAHCSASSRSMHSTAGQPYRVVSVAHPANVCRASETSSPRQI